MTKGKKAGLVVLIFLAALLASVIIVNTRRTPVEKTMTVCTLDGEAAELSLHLYWHDHIFFLNEPKGYFSLDGTEYFSPYGYEYEGKTRIRRQSNVSFSKGFKDKFINRREQRMMFSDFGENGNFDPMVQKVCYLYHYDRRFGRVEITRHWFGEGSITYYGPAETAEEAQAILDAIIEEHLGK